MGALNRAAGEVPPLRYRLIFFSPRPYTGERIAVGVTWRAGAAPRLYWSENLPTQPFLSDGAAALLEIVRDRFAADPATDTCRGPHFIVGEWRDVGFAPTIGAEKWIAGMLDGR